MATPLPDKATEYAARTAEEARRKDPTQANVAQEAIDCLEELEATGRSSSEVFIVYGYSLSHVLKLALQDENSIVNQLRRMPSAEVVAQYLDVNTVKTKYGIAEFEPVELQGAKVIK